MSALIIFCANITLHYPSENNRKDVFKNVLMCQNSKTTFICKQPDKLIDLLMVDYAFEQRYAVKDESQCLEYISTIFLQYYNNRERMCNATLREFLDTNCKTFETNTILILGVSDRKDLIAKGA